MFDLTPRSFNEGQVQALGDRRKGDPNCIAGSCYAMLLLYGTCTSCQLQGQAQRRLVRGALSGQCERSMRLSYIVDAGSDAGDSGSPVRKALFDGSLGQPPFSRVGWQGQLFSSDTVAIWVARLPHRSSHHHNHAPIKHHPESKPRRRFSTTGLNAGFYEHATIILETANHDHPQQLPHWLFPLAAGAGASRASHLPPLT